MRIHFDVTNFCLCSTVFVLQAPELFDVKVNYYMYCTCACALLQSEKTKQTNELYLCLEMCSWK